MAHILVTGAAGFIGSHTVDRLLADGHHVVGVDNFRTGRRENLRQASTSARFSLREADVSADGAISAIIASLPASSDALIHLAALVSVPESIAQPELNYTLNLRATHLVAEAARQHGIRRIVFASSAAVYGETRELPIHENAEKNPISPYGAAKLASEALLLGHAAAFGLTVRCQRYFNVFGPRQDPGSPYSGVISIFDRRVRAGQPVTIFGNGRQSRDFVSVHDVARANVIAATRPDLVSGVANICTGRGTSLLEVLDVFRHAFPHAPAPIHAAPRFGDIQHSVGAAEAAERALGFRAEISVARGLEELMRQT